MPGESIHDSASEDLRTRPESSATWSTSVLDYLSPSCQIWRRRPNAVLPPHMSRPSSNSSSLTQMAPAERWDIFIISFSSSGSYTLPLSTPLSTGERLMTFQQNSKFSRPKTAMVVLNRGTCNRVRQLEQEPARQYNFRPHLPQKRTRPPPWQRGLEDEASVSHFCKQTSSIFAVGPGYTWSRSKSKNHITIKNEFFSPDLSESHRKKTNDPERESLTVMLQQQISDLTLYVEEERLNHKQTKQKAEEFLKDQIDQIKSEFQDQIRDLKEDHKEELLRQKQQMEAEHKEIQDTMERQISRMASELELLQSAFESYKGTLRSETTQKQNRVEGEHRLKFEEEKQQAIHEIKTKLIQEQNQERANMTREYRKAVDALRKEHKKELDGLLQRFSNAAADIERLKLTTMELEETKSELEKMKENYSATCQQLASTTRHLTDVKVRLVDFEERFQEKVQQVDDQYRHRLQELMTQNTELRRMFVQKCGELFDEKENSNEKTTQRVRSARETMELLVKSKQRANISIALGGPPENVKTSKSRPMSAPGTRRETKMAHETAGEVESKAKT